jgi:hypothetical protein
MDRIDPAFLETTGFEAELVRPRESAWVRMLRLITATRSTS